MPPSSVILQGPRYRSSSVILSKPQSGASKDPSPQRRGFFDSLHFVPVAQNDTRRTNLQSSCVILSKPRSGAPKDPYPRREPIHAFRQHRAPPTFHFHPVGFSVPDDPLLPAYALSAICWHYFNKEIPSFPLTFLSHLFNLFPP